MLGSYSTPSLFEHIREGYTTLQLVATHSAHDNEDGFHPSYLIIALVDLQLRFKVGSSLKLIF